ncbi:hypothetical protein ACFONG_02370 [Uliginosibacterium paludis]|uniref:Replication protein n=1 Tax=Uliginosibacterium paludis TaxID=1615952 RepID=A0ABV2CPF9_9RHOO
MTSTNPPSTPVSRSKTAALARTIDLVTKGYHFYCTGQCPARRLPALLRKFHERYNIGCSPAQRLTRKQKGLANAALVVFLPQWDASEDGADANNSGDASDSCLASQEETAQASDPAPRKASVQRHAGSVEDAVRDMPADVQVEWLLLVTKGTGAAHEQEQLCDVTDKQRLVFCRYELVRHSARGKAAWTWRRTRAEMGDLFALLEEQLKRRHVSSVALTLARIARQPGFAGVREQSWRLCQFARQHGYDGELPYLYFVQKVAHGERCLLQDRRGRLTQGAEARFFGLAG